MINCNAILRIAILIAMQEEADPIVSKLGMIPVDPTTLGFNSHLDIKVYQTFYREKGVYLIQNGRDAKHNGVDRVSVIPAAVVTSVTIEVLKPHLIISAGTAGGLKGAKIGDVFVSNNPFVFCDRVIDTSTSRVYAEGHRDYYPIPLIAETLDLKLGTVATSSSLNPTERELRILEKLKADVIDMESASIAEVAEMYKVKMIAVKVVTNYLNKELHKDAVNNLENAAYKLANKIALMVPLLLEKPRAKL